MYALRPLLWGYRTQGASHSSITHRCGAGVSEPVYGTGGVRYSVGRHGALRVPDEKDGGGPLHLSPGQRVFDL